MVDKAIQIILVLSPIVYFRTMTQNVFDMMFFHLCAVVLFMASLFDHPVREFSYSKESLALFAVCLFNVILHRFDMYVMNSVLNLFIGFVCVYILVRYVQSLNKLRTAIAIAAAINIAAYVIQRAGFNPFSPMGSQNHLGAFLNTNCRFTTYLSTILPVCSGSPYIILPVFIAVSIWAKQQAILIPAATYLMLKAKNINLKALVLIAAVASVFIPVLSTFHSSGHVSVRIETWKNVINGLMNNPVCGYGFGVFPWGPDKVLANADAAIYSSLLQFVCGLGVLSIAWLVWVIKRVFKYDGSIESISIVCLGVLCIYEYPFEIPKLWPTLIAIISMFLIRMQSNKEVVDAG